VVDRFREPVTIRFTSREIVLTMDWLSESTIDERGLAPLRDDASDAC
jgi:hypothetical protein